MRYATCTSSAHFLSSYDPEAISTPALGELARQGFVFDGSQTESSQSGGSFASLFTGTETPAHGALDPNVRSDERRVIAESFLVTNFTGIHGLDARDAMPRDRAPYPIPFASRGAARK